jgi:hypothetical protein
MDYCQLSWFQTKTETEPKFEVLGPSLKNRMRDNTQTHNKYVLGASYHLDKESITGF